MSYRLKTMETSAPKLKFWFVAALIGALLGTYLRFVGLGTWPMARDEYYLYRSISFLLQKGLPIFDCGGLYARGLLMQYATAPLLAAGMSPELALRLFAALASLLALAGSTALGYRIGGTRVAATILIVLSLSAWQIEMGRFGRMYAPFQALFIWYVYHAYRLVTAGDLKRWRWLLALSAVGPLVWEGGIVLVLFNFVPILMSRSYWRPTHVVISIGLLIASYEFLTTNFRYVGTDPDQLPPIISGSPGYFSEATLLSAQLPGNPFWAGTLAVLVLAFLALLARSVIQRHAHPLVLTCMTGAAILLLLNQFLLTIFFCTGLLLVGWLNVNDLSTRALRPLMMSICALGVFWLAYIGGTFPSITSIDTFKSAFQILMGFPNVIDVIAWPWLEVMPFMAMVVLAGVTASTTIVLLNSAEDTKGVRLILAGVLLGVTVISIAPTLYNQTRYSFFLYPMLILLCAYALVAGRDLLPARIRPSLATALFALPLVLFVGNHFHFSHLLSIDQYDGNFRVNFSAELQRHYYRRLDNRSAARFVREQAGESDAVVSTSVLVTHYLQRPSYIYLDATDARYPDQACNSGSQERWTGARLLGSISDVEQVATTNGSQTWFVIERATRQSEIWDQTLATSGEYELRHTTPDNAFDVYRRASTGAIRE